MEWQRCEHPYEARCACRILRQFSVYNDVDSLQVFAACDDSGGELWIGRVPGHALAVGVTPLETQTMLVSYCMPWGKFDAREAMELAWAKIWECCRRRGMRQVVAYYMKEYDDPDVNAFFGCVKGLTGFDRETDCGDAMRVDLSCEVGDG